VEGVQKNRFILCFKIVKECFANSAPTLAKKKLRKYISFLKVPEGKIQEALKINAFSQLFLQYT